MKNSKVYKHISILTKKERKKLELFICSPFFVSKKEQVRIMPLYQLIVKKISSQSFTKEEAYRSLFQGQVFVKGKLEKVMTSLFQNILSFIESEYYASNNKEGQKYLAHANFYRRKKMNTDFHSSITKGKSKQNKILAKDCDDFYHNYLLEREISNFSSSQQHIRSNDLNLPQTIKTFNIFYLSQRLEYAVWKKSHNTHISYKEEVDSFDKVLPFFLEDNGVDNAFINIYSHTLNLLEKNSEKKFHIFNYISLLLDKEQKKIPLSTTKAIKSILRVHATSNYNLGNNKYLQSTFDLYKKHLDEGDLYYVGKLHSSSIINIVKLGLELKESDWVNSFLLNHQDKIMGSSAEDVFQFNLAYYYFRIKKINKALDLLNDNYKDIYYRIAAKRLELKIHYEQSSSLLSYRLDAFKVFIFRQSDKQLPKKKLAANNNFLFALKKIISPITLGNRKRVEKLIQQIQSSDLMSERRWLIEKLNELNK